MRIPSEEELLQAACHIGHRAEKWNPKMKPFIYGERKGIHIFDLTKTRELLERTCALLSKLHREGKVILFVSTKQHSMNSLEELGRVTGHPTVTRKWIGGLLTNWKTISRRIRYYLDLQESFRTREVEKYTKKEQGALRKKLTKLDNALGGVAGMSGLPHALFVVDAVRDVIAVREAHTIGIPIFGICDSNADPDFFTIPIPANDDSVNSVRLILETVKGVLLEAGREKEHATQGEGTEVKEGAVVGAGA